MKEMRNYYRILMMETATWKTEGHRRMVYKWILGESAVKTWTGSG
jgi:hypothetical protein